MRLRGLAAEAAACPLVDLLAEMLRLFVGRVELPQVADGRGQWLDDTALVLGELLLGTECSLNDR